MGWFANMLFGKPKTVVTPAAENQDDWVDDGASDTDTPPPPDAAAVEAAEPPEVRFTKVETRLSNDGTQVEVWVTATNTYKSELEITHIECLGRSTEPSRFLAAGQSFDIEVYNGQLPSSDSRQKGSVTYKSIESGCYYQADILIKYRYTQHASSEHYLPYEFNIQLPVNCL